MPNQICFRCGKSFELATRNTGALCKDCLGESTKEEHASQNIATADDIDTARTIIKPTALDKK